MNRLRDEAWRLDGSLYPLRFDMRASYGDMDSFRHLNNVALARYLEEGRAALNIRVFGVDSVVRPSDDTQLLVAGVTIDYVSQGEYPGQVTVAAGVGRIGRSSFSQATAIFQDGRCVALCDAVTVYAVAGVAREIPAAARELLLKSAMPASIA